MRPRYTNCLAAILLASPLGAQAKHPITFADFAAVRAVADPQMSPDGKSVMYAVRTADVAANRRTPMTFIQLVDGGAMRAFPDSATHATDARWSPDGARIAYIAGGQLWVASADGSGKKQLTELNQGAGGPVWSPTGDRIAFVSGVYASCRTESCNADSAKARESSKVKAHIADALMYRHWNAWDEGTRAHLFIIARDGSGLRDVTEGAPYDVPPGPFGGSEGYAFSPDGKEIAYSAKDQGRQEAWTTDINVYVVPVAGGRPNVITSANKGGDQNPVYSADGRYIAYASQAHAGFESDRWRLMLYDRAAGRSHELLPKWDRNADAYIFAPDSKSIVVQTEDAGRNKLYRFAIAQDGTGGKPQLLVGEHNSTSFTLSADGGTVAFVRDATDRPAELFVGSLDASSARGVRQLTHLNDALVSQLAMNPAEDFWFKVADGDSVQGFIVKPPQWEPGKKYPVVLLIHGGPQGAWLDQFHGRWNYQMFAASGFGLVIINPRGSFGYGQKFVDEVSRDWGGKVYNDLMTGFDYALAHNAWLDGTHAGAAGGSFGGYMVDWIAGHTNRFKALVSHAGPYNLENMYGATEELWFAEWEYTGPYWNSKSMADQYRKYSPHLYAKNFKTPTLVTGGELDYRVPYTEDLSFFTALQRQGVPSRLVMFPDEGHWIGKPQNQRLWWGEVQGWLKKYLSPNTTM
ncbi:MAG: S9 family peptidase [Gemmatimonadota bacterium]|nr:S9 family peptidase [Gemmatimonadota bacterium]